MRDFIISPVFSLSVGLLVTGCEPPPPVDPVDDIRARTSSDFTAASLFRIDPTSAPGFDVYMAPMLLLERSSTRGLAGVSLGALRRASDGSLALDSTQPVVYFERSRVTVAGRDREQLAFLWFFSSVVGSQTLRVQGVRYTLDDGGFPVIQEVLADPSGFRVLYVAEKLSASESNADVVPRAVLAKSMRDGPVPMGPFVYMRPGRLEVTTLLCRCAPSQVSEFPEEITYAVVPLEELKGIGFESLCWSAGILESTAPEPPVPDDWLERVLRLPTEW